MRENVHEGPEAILRCMHRRAFLTLGGGGGGGVAKTVSVSVCLCACVSVSLCLWCMCARARARVCVCVCVRACVHACLPNLDFLTRSNH